MKNKLFTVVGAVALVAASGIGGYTLFATKDRPSATTSPIATPTQQSTSARATTPVSTTSAPVATSGYMDGDYIATSRYHVPEGGTNTLTATVTIRDGKILSVTSSSDYSGGESQMYVDSFSGSVNSQASGQSIASYSPSRIGGASLTTGAFRSALDTVRSQAKT